MILNFTIPEHRANYLSPATTYIVVAGEFIDFSYILCITQRRG